MIAIIIEVNDDNPGRPLTKFNLCQIPNTIKSDCYFPTRHLWDSEGTGTELLVRISPDYRSVGRPIGGPICSESLIVNIDFNNNVY